jgi:hypothetical protein
MNQRARFFSWILSAALVGVVALALVLLVLPGVLPGRAAWPSNSPDALTNPQKAAILGSQNLLQLNYRIDFIYLPTLNNH